MTRDPLASGDPLAERRFAYARAAADEGDFNAAAEVLEQALERAPDWAAAWFALGEAREKLGEIAPAARAFRATLTADPADAQGAAARLALLGGADKPEALPKAYVARLFDQYAPGFDAHLTGKLNYRGPALIAEALDLVAPGRRFSHALDIGCGTGAMGETVRVRIDRLAGVDLSRGMIAKANELGLYDSLEVAEATGFLERSAPGTFDCILAADALCYFGDLKPALIATARALADNGLFAFSIETFDGEGFRLEPTMRFAHARSYVESAARETGWRPLLIRSQATRCEADADVPGLICVFEKGRHVTGRVSRPPALAAPG
jgi:predicted TPR repeat methyltransferase